MKTNKFCWEIFHEHFLWPFTRGNNKMPPWNSKRKLFVFTLSYFGEIIFRNLHVVCNMCWVYFRFIGLAFFKYHVFSECKDTWNPIIWQVCHKNWFIELLLYRISTIWFNNYLHEWGVFCIFSSRILFYLEFICSKQAGLTENS